MLFVSCTALPLAAGINKDTSAACLAKKKACANSKVGARTEVLLGFFSRLAHLFGEIKAGSLLEEGVTVHVGLDQIITQLAAGFGVCLGERIKTVFAAQELFHISGRSLAIQLEGILAFLDQIRIVAVQRPVT